MLGKRGLAWKDYTFTVTPRPIRRFLSFLLSGLSSNKELFPYFSGAPINYDLKLTRHAKTTDRQLNYEWRLIKSSDEIVVDSHGGQSEIDVPRFNLFTEKPRAISLGRIFEKGRYKVQFSVGSGAEKSSYSDVAEFTVKGKGLQYALITVVTVIIVALGGITGMQAKSILGKRGEDAQTKQQTGLPPSAWTSTANATTVIIDNFAYYPPVLTVERGATVTWTNKYPLAHRVNADVGSSINFTSPNLGTGASFVWTFSESGNYTYYCGNHPSMKGTIVVR